MYHNNINGNIGREFSVLLQDDAHLINADAADSDDELTSA